MLPRERVIQVIRHQAPDRMPIYGWLRENLSDQISEAYGSVEAFEDRYEFDFAHLFGGPPTYRREDIDRLAAEAAGEVLPEMLLELDVVDPDETDAYRDIAEGIRHHKERRGRFVYVQTPGIFEALNDAFGIENHLMHLALHEEALGEVYRRQAEWNRAFAMNCLDLGVDMIHVSDDWGTQRGLMFSPETWRRMIYPNHAITCEAVKSRGAFISVHSDGEIMSVIDGVIELGYDVVHPWQESAGMDLAVFKRKYASRFSVMGGLDIQNVLGFGDPQRVRAAIERVVDMFADGGLLLCTTHFVQDHCTIEELAFAYDLVCELTRGRKPGGRTAR